MRYAVAALVLIAAIPAFGRAPEDKPQLIAELLEVLDARNLIHGSLDTMVGTVRRLSEGPDVAPEEVPEEYRAEWELERKRENEKAERLRDVVFRHVDHVRYADEIYAPLLDDRFSADELRELIAFFRTKTGQKMAGVIPQLAGVGPAGRDWFMKAAELAAEEIQKEENAATPWKSTMADMRSIATAAEARATDTNEYPRVTFEELESVLAPTYIREVPKVDAWGTPFVYTASADGMHYRIVSAGADKRFEWSSREIDVTDPQPRSSDSDSADIIFQDGTFIQFPRESIREH